MTKHTPEPWRFICANDETGHEPCIMRCDAIGLVSAPQHPADEAEDEANARRIVACVNACAGISTEALESGALREVVGCALSLFDANSEVLAPFEKNAIAKLRSKP